MSTSPEQEIKEGSDSNIEENESIGENIFIGSLKFFRNFEPRHIFCSLQTLKSNGKNEFRKFEVFTIENRMEKFSAI